MNGIAKQLIFPGIPLGFFAVLILRRFWFQRRVLKLIGNEITGSRFTEICNSMVRINASCQEHAFEVKRAGKILIQGRSIILIWGSIDTVSIGSRGRAFLNSMPALYALVDASELDLMETNRKMFSPLFLGSPFSVFGVHFPTLVKALKAES